MTDKLTGDEILESHGATDVLEELLQSVTAQALRMGRVEDGQHELRASLQALQQVVEQIGVREAAQTADGNANTGMHEQLDAAEKAAKQAARRSSIAIFIAVLQLILIGGLIAQSYMKMNAADLASPAPAALKPVEAPKPPEPAAIVAPAPAPAPPPEPAPEAKSHHGKWHRGKK